MARINILSIRLDNSERQLAENVAARLGHTESSLVRQLLNEKARRLGIPTDARKEVAAHAT